MVARDLARLWADAPFAGTKGVICRTPEVVEAMKREAPELRTLMHHDLLPPEATPYLDAWLSAGDWITRPDLIALAPYDVEVYMYFEEYGGMNGCPSSARGGGARSRS